MPTYGGIDLGGTKIQVIVMRGDDHSVLGQARTLTPHEGGPAAVIDALVACMSVAAGTLARAGNLPEWERPVPLAATLAQRLGVSARLGNDVSVATNAELLLGAGRGASSLLGVFWGTGVGGGVVLDGKLWHGRGDAGEIGHMVVKQGGARCMCGRRGCMEAY